MTFYDVELKMAKGGTMVIGYTAVGDYLLYPFKPFHTHSRSFSLPESSG